MEEFGLEQIFQMFPKLLALGTPGLIVFGIVVAAFGAYSIWKASGNFKKQVDNAEIDAANAASSSNDALDSTDDGGNSFLDS